MKRQNNNFQRNGFSLTEVLAALVIGAMILVAVLGVYTRAQRASAAIMDKLDGDRIPAELLQRIAEDVDRIIVAEQDTKITIENKFIDGFPSARMTILKTFYGSDNKAKIFEKIVWQASSDYESVIPGLMVYRSYSGLTGEDKLFDEERKDWEEKYSFIPICRGVTFFKIQAIKNETILDEWENSSMPGGIILSISFAEPFKTLNGSWDVPEDEKFTRTIAVDRTRKIRFSFRRSDDTSDGKTEQPEDSNKASDPNEAPDPNKREQ